MTDSQVRNRLHAAVDGTTAPPAFALSVLQRGRARRRRRYAAAALAAGVVVAAGAFVTTDPPPVAQDSEVAAQKGGDAARALAALDWARSLPAGAEPALPFFGEGGALWADGQAHAVPARVNRGYSPRAVAGGWVVLVGGDEVRLGLALLGQDGSMRDLPGSVRGVGSARIVVSDDGSRVAFDRWVVDLDTFAAQEVPHTPPSPTQDDYVTEIRMIGWTADGLVYEGAPFEKGFGATYLLRADGSSVAIPVPGGAHISDQSPADVAVDFAYDEDQSDTCVSSWLLRDEQWQARKTFCMGESLGEALSASPGGAWLTTGDLPRVWGLADGEWHRVDMPADLAPAQMAAQEGGAVWESEDEFLLPIADRWMGLPTAAQEFEQQVQIVRCSVTSGECERAGDEQQVDVTASMFTSTVLALEPK